MDMNSTQRRWRALSAGLMIFISYTAVAQDSANNFARERISGFGAIPLGAPRATLERLVEESAQFIYEQTEYSRLPNSDLQLIQVAGREYIAAAHFQLSGDAVVAIVLDLNEERIDHYTIYTHLVSKYGEPQQFGPRMARWESDGASLILERPLTIKYLDQTYFDRLLNISNELDSAQQSSRARFLDDL